MNRHDPSDDEKSRDADLSAADLLAYDELLARGDESGAALADRDGPCDDDDLELDRQCVEMLREAWPPIAPAGVDEECPAVRTLGDFRLLRQIGHGGMGVVYEAEQLSLGRRVALKILPFAAMLDERHLARFKHEASAAAGLHHPHIVPVLAFGSEDGVHYYAMQYVEGEPLNKIVHALRAQEGQDGASIPSAVPSELQADDGCVQVRCRHYFRAVAELGLQAAEALDYAHQHGVIHRDVKPANLLLDADGNLWIADFGLARSESDGALTKSGDVVGTLRYMSPEQASGKRAAPIPATDIYSLGATLYELLTLEPLFGRSEQSDLLRKIADEDPQLPRRLAADLPRDLETIVLKALEKSPEDRYESAQDLADDLQRFLRDEPIRAQPPTPRERLIKWSRRHEGVVWTAAGFAALLVIVLSVGSAMLVRAARNAKSAQERATVSAATASRDRNEALENLYIANVRLAQQEWYDGNLTAVKKLLDAHIPADNQKDLRGWEWHYLESLCHRDLATLRGHTKGIQTVAWSPDGQLIASAGGDFAVRVWNATTHEELGALSGHSDRVDSVAWSPDGSQIASTGRDKTVRVWDVAKSETVLEIPASDRVLLQVAWSPDGSRLATCDNRAVVRIWDATTGKKLIRMKDVGRSFAWSPDGSRFASGGTYESPTIQIWDANTGRQTRQFLDAHDHAVVDVAWSQDGRQLATASEDQSVRIWDVKTGKWRQKIDAHNGAVRSVAWSPNGAQLATADADGSVKAGSTADGRLLNVLRGHLGTVQSVQWSPDGKRLASGSMDSTVKIWDPHDEQSFTSVGDCGGFSWSPDGRRLATVMDKDGDDPGTVLQIMEMESSAIQRLPFPPADKFRIHRLIAWSPDGSRIACGAYSSDSSECVTRVYDRATLAEIVSFEEPPQHERQEVRCIAWSPDGHYVATARNVGSEDEHVIVWEMATGKEAIRLKHDVQVDSVAWSPDGMRVATFSLDQIVKIWEVGTWRESLKLNCHPDFIRAVGGGEHKVAWTPDGSKLAAGTARGWLIMWEASTGREVFSFKVHTAPIRSIAISANGLRIATVSDDKTVKIWDSAGRQLLTLRGHHSQVDSVAWSPNGAWLVTSGGDGLRIWGGSKDWRTD